MSNTIRKRADELKPGDVRLCQGERIAFQYVSCAPPMAHMSQDHRLYSFAGLGREVNTAPASERLGEWMPPDWPVEVEAPALSPAQQHAEELLAFVRKIAASDYAQADEEAREVLAKIDPPVPPTLEEALELLGEALDATAIGFEPLDRRISQFRDRARRAGVLKP